MTMYADRAMSILTVIVIVAVENLIFQPVRKELGRTAKHTLMQRQAWHFDSQSACCKGARAPLDPPNMRLTA